MTEENPLTIAELGAYTNNSMNREGIKKLVDKVNNAGTPPEYTGENGIVIENDVIKLSNDWIECPNKIDDMVEYGSSYQYLIKGKTFNIERAVILDLADDVEVTTKMDFNDVICKIVSKWDYGNNGYVNPIFNIANTTSSKGSIRDIKVFKTSDTAFDFTDSNVTITAKDFAGNVVDASNIDNYMSIVDNVYSITKPFFVFLKKSSKYATILMLYGEDFTFYCNGTRNYNANVSIAGVYKIIKGETPTIAERTMYYYHTTMGTNTDVMSLSDNDVKVYRRKKLSKIPIPEVTP